MPVAPRQHHHAFVSQGLALAIVVAWLGIHVTTVFGTPVTNWSLSALIAVLLVQTWLSTGLFIIAHDCMHGSLAPGRPLGNRLVGRFALLIYAGLDYDRMLPGHYAHHRHVGSATDPDFHIGSPRKPWRWFLRFFGNYYTHIQLVRITVVACIYLWLGASLINFAVFWAIPALLALAQLFFFGTYLPHRHSDDSFTDRHNARSVGPGGVLSLLSCFHFGGYHHEHHIHPQTPWWLLPAIRTDRRG